MDSFLSRIAAVWLPHEGQRDFLTCPAKIRVLACGRRWGKTDACAASIVAELLCDSVTRHLILAPTLDQAKLLFDRVLELIGKLGLAEECKAKVTPYPQLSFQGHRVSARSGHVGRLLRGNEATHVLVDEAAFVPESLIAEVAMPMLATNNGRLTLISTPNGLNHFWKFFKMGEAGEHGVWSRSAPSAESPYVSPEFLRVQREVISERAFDIEYEAKFVDAAGQVFSVPAIESCIVPLIEPEEAPIFIGVDWGRYEDYTAVAVVQGSQKGAQLLHVDQFRRADWPAMVERVADIVTRYPGARVLGDGTGAGDVVTDMLRSRLRGFSVGNFTFTSSKKQELIERLRSLIERGAVRFAPDPELIRQLKHFEASVSPSGRQQLNARSGYHDDLVIAMALACRQLPKGNVSTIELGSVRRFARGQLQRPHLCFDDLVWKPADPQEDLCSSYSI